MKPQKETAKNGANFVKKGGEKVSPKDFETVLNKTEELKKKFDSEGPLGRFIEDFKLLVSIVRDYWSGTYKEIPYWAISAIVFALIYVLSPVDLIPDMIPGIGLVDDALVVAGCLLLVEQELHKYKKWKLKNSN